MRNITKVVHQIHDLKERGEEYALTHLKEALQDKNKRVRKAAIDTIEWFVQTVIFKDILLEALNDSSEYVRGKAALKLGYTYLPELVNPLLKLLNDESNKVRCQAACSLGTLCNKMAVLPMIEALGNNSIKVKMHIIQSLGRIRDTRADSVIISCLSDDRLFEISAEALTNLYCNEAEKGLITRLNGKKSKFRSIAARSLGRIRSPNTAKALSARLKIEKNNEVRRCILYAVYELNAINDSPDSVVLDVLIDILENSNSNSDDDKDGAAKALGVLGNPAAIKPLLNNIYLKPGILSSEVIAALGELKVEEAFEVLENLIIENLYEQDQGVEKLIDAYVLIGGRKALALLLMIIENSIVSFRWDAIVAIGWIGLPTDTHVLDVLNNIVNTSKDESEVEEAGSSIYMINTK